MGMMRDIAYALFRAYKTPSPQNISLGFATPPHIPGLHAFFRYLLAFGYGLHYLVPFNYRPPDDTGTRILHAYARYGYALWQHLRYALGLRPLVCVDR